MDLDNWKPRAIVLMHYIPGAKCGIMVSLETNQSSPLGPLFCYLLFHVKLHIYEKDLVSFIIFMSLFYFLCLL